MSKLNWSLAATLLTIPLAASCSRQSSEPQQTMRDDSPTIVTQTVMLDELIAKTRQIERSRQTRQQLESQAQQHQVVAVELPSPEKQLSDWRPLWNDQQVQHLQQQIRHARRQVNSGLRVAATRASATIGRLRTVAMRVQEDALAAEEPTDSEEPASEEPADAVEPEDAEQDAAQAEPMSEQPPTDELPTEELPTEEPEVEVSPSDEVAAVQKLPPPQTTRTMRACRTPARLLRSSPPRLGRRIARLRSKVQPCPTPTIVVVRPVVPVVRPAARQTVLNRCSSPSIRRAPLRTMLRRR